MQLGLYTHEHSKSEEAWLILARPTLLCPHIAQVATKGRVNKFHYESSIASASLLYKHV